MCEKAFKFGMFEKPSRTHNIHSGLVKGGRRSLTASAQREGGVSLLSVMRFRCSGVFLINRGAQQL